MLLIRLSGRCSIALYAARRRQYLGGNGALTMVELMNISDISHRACSIFIRI
jgi:hypothetical protein